MHNTKIFKTLCFLEGERGDIYTLDTIEHEGKLWLVPEWLEAPSEGWKKPARIISLDRLPHQKAPSNFQEDFVLTYPIPRVVLNGQTQQQQASDYEIVEEPDLRFPIPRGIH